MQLGRNEILIGTDFRGEPHIIEACTTDVMFNRLSTHDACLEEFNNDGGTFIEGAVKGLHTLSYIGSGEDTEAMLTKAKDER